MSIELIVASVAITCALVLYTFGVFGERRSGTLSLRHVLLFWGGLVCDTTGTMIMSNIAQQSSAGGFGIHAVTGLLAIVLMLVHAVWATVTYVRHNVPTDVCYAAQGFGEELLYGLVRQDHGLSFRERFVRSGTSRGRQRG